jgi:hypothetical protein
MIDNKIGGIMEENVLIYTWQQVKALMSYWQITDLTKLANRLETTRQTVDKWRKDGGIKVLKSEATRDLVHQGMREMRLRYIGTPGMRAYLEDKLMLILNSVRNPDIDEDTIEREIEVLIGYFEIRKKRLGGESHDEGN